MAHNAVDRLDALPENTPYRDDGCGHGCVRSLECPFPRCRYDDPGIWLKLERQRREEELLALRAAERVSAKELAGRLGISRRTVHRILARAGRRGPEEAERTSLGIRKLSA